MLSGVKRGDTMAKDAGSAVLALVLGLLLLPAGARADDKLTLVLNWVPTADHSPYFYAKRQGWYAKAGIDLAIETGKGSGVTAQRVGTGNADLGIADLATALVMGIILQPATFKTYGRLPGPMLPLAARLTAACWRVLHA